MQCLLQTFNMVNLRRIDRQQVTSGGAFRHLIVIRLSHWFFASISVLRVKADTQNHPAYFLKLMWHPPYVLICPLTSAFHR